MNRWLSRSIATAALMLLAPDAIAHITLSFPPPRTTMQKAGPCGIADSVRGTTVTTFKPGEKVMITWTETIEHPGHFRISIDEDGNDSFVVPKDYTDFDPDPTILVNNITDQTGAAPHTYSQEITIPNKECANCTLQLLQTMTDKPPFGPAGGNDFYYQCADIVISATGMGSSASSGSGSGSGSGSSGSSGSGSGSTTGSGAGGDSGSGGAGGEDGGGDGCSCRTTGGSGAGSFAAIAFVALAWLAKVRRSRT
jgi:MYXO-CTERM domain-containing protein